MGQIICVFDYIAFVFEDCRSWFYQINTYLNLVDELHAFLVWSKQFEKISDFGKWYLWSQTWTSCSISNKRALKAFLNSQFVVKLYAGTYLHLLLTKICEEKHRKVLKIFLQFLNFFRLLRSPSKAKSVHELSATIYDSLPQSLKEPVAVRSKIEDPELQQQRFELTRLVFGNFCFFRIFFSCSKF